MSIFFQIVDETLCYVNRQNALIEEKRKSKKEKKETDADIAALHSIVTAWRGRGLILRLTPPIGPTLRPLPRPNLF